MGRKIRVCKDFTYSSIIKEAILATRDKKATSSQIFTYITNKHPGLFKQSNSMTWKGNIRQLLSKNPEFVKLKKDEKSKLHYWKYVPLEEIIESEKDIMYRYTDKFNDPGIPQKQYNYSNYYDPNLVRLNPSVNNMRYYQNYQHQPNDIFYGNPNEEYNNLPNNFNLQNYDNQNDFEFQTNFDFPYDRKNKLKNEKKLSSSEMFENIKNYEESSQFGLFSNTKNYNNQLRQDFNNGCQPNEWKHNQYIDQEREIQKQLSWYEEDQYYKSKNFEKNNLIDDSENERGKIKFKFVNNLNEEENQLKDHKKIKDEENQMKQNKIRNCKENAENKQI